jgi:hypothetical protein
MYLCQSVTEACIVSQFFYTYSTELSAMDAWPNALDLLREDRRQRQRQLAGRSPPACARGRYLTSLVSFISNRITPSASLSFTNSPTSSLSICKLSPAPAIHLHIPRPDLERAPLALHYLDTSSASSGVGPILASDAQLQTCGCVGLRREIHRRQARCRWAQQGRAVRGKYPPR